MQFAKDNGLDYLHYGFIRANGLVLGSMAEVASQVKIYSEVASHLLRNPVHS